MYNQETIKFDIHLRSVYENNPPHAKILLNNEIKFANHIEKNTVISFTETLTFTDHQFVICRDNTEPNQLLYIDKVVMDGVDIRDILWIKSYNVPIYPQPWAKIQKKLGINLEEKIVGETCLGHNSTWYLDFYSPTYRFVMDWMKGIYD